MNGTTRVLMIYPRFNPDSFWNYQAACELVGARYPTAPLGLITVAAMLPANWDIRLVNRNTEELTDSDLEWSDMVMTGGMMVQQPDALRLIDMCRARGKPVVVGGPDATSSPHVYKNADFQVLGEAEGIITEFVAAWESGRRAGVFKAEPFKVDVTRTPVPRFDLLKPDHYLYIGVQYSRGCPFTCEFCDIIELYGRVPRTKTNAQMLAELDALYDLGYRGHVDFVDDNLIGNKKAVKQFLPELAAWMEAKQFPFEFSTEASLNLAEDPVLLNQLRKAHFFAVFVGIETPNVDTLTATRKKQNTRRDLVESIHAIYAAGLFVTAGFIVGFDTEKNGIADEMIAFIHEAAIPISLVSLLTALPNTQLTRRLAAEGRLHPDHEFMPEGLNDTCGQGLNFEPVRSASEVLRDYAAILRAVFDPVAYCGRIRRLAELIDRSGHRDGIASQGKFDVEGFKLFKALLDRVPDHRELFWRTFVETASMNPKATKIIIMQLAFYLHLGPFSRKTIEHIESRIRELERGSFTSPQAAQFAGLARP